MPEGMGKAQFVLNVAQYFVVFAALGIPLYGVREIAKSKHDPKAFTTTFREILVISGGSSLVVTVVYLLLIWNLHPFNTAPHLYFLVGTLIFFNFLNVDWLFSGLELFKKISIRSIVIKVLSLLGLFLLVKDEGDLEEYLSITVFSFLGYHLWNFFDSHKYFVQGTGNLQLRRHIKPILLNFGVLFAISIYTVFDTVLLGLLADAESVGYYVAAVKISKVIIPVITSLGVVVLPKLSLAMHQDNQQAVQQLVKKSFWYINLLAIPAFLGLFAFAKEFISLFSGPAYNGAIVPMKLLSPLVVLIGLAHLFAFQLLIPAKKERSYLYAVATGSICCLALNIILVPQYGVIGAAIANLSAEFIITLMAFCFVRRFFKLNLAWGRFFIRIMYVGIIFGLVAMGCRLVSSESLVILGIGVPVCFLLYVFMIMFIEKDTDLRSFASEQLHRLFGQ